MKYLFAVDAANYAALKKLVESDPMAEESFARLGFILKAGESMAGGEKGKYYLYFSADEGLGGKLAAQVKAIPSAVEVTGSAKDALVAVIEGEQDAAAEGFGAIFG